MMRVNLRGGFVTLRECARAMVALGRPGAIVAVTSVSGFLTDRSMAHYSVSKAGLAALVRVAARELGPHGIRVNGVAPGTTDTPMFAATDRMRGYRERVAGRAALGRVGSAAEVAQAIVALCTLDWVTGQIVAADGGVSLASPIDPMDPNRDRRPHRERRASERSCSTSTASCSTPRCPCTRRGARRSRRTAPRRRRSRSGRPRSARPARSTCDAWLVERATTGRSTVDAMNESRRAHRDALLERGAGPARGGRLARRGRGRRVRPRDRVELAGRLGRRAPRPARAARRFAHVVTAGGDAPREARARHLSRSVRAARRRARVTRWRSRTRRNGIAAAKAAGLHCVTVPHTLTATLDLSAADLRLASLADCTLADVDARLSELR